MDTQDRFVLHVIDVSSYLNGTKFDIIDEDDTDDAQAYADALREANESAPLDGTITIPGLTLAYAIGDPIKGIYGRNISFRVNQGASKGEAAVYPIVSGITYNFDGCQRRHCTFPRPDMTRRSSGDGDHAGGVEVDGRWRTSYQGGGPDE